MTVQRRKGLRHSFISALASKGVDQRIIDDLVGRQTVAPAPHAITERARR
jgi:site-specific recombinase XerD